MLVVGICPYCCKECMGKQFYLFVCYEDQELSRAMYGGGNNYIEERFA
jgi:hypothetical protein